MAKKKQLTASLEDYLEAIFRLVRDHKVARAKEIAERLDVSMPSVTGALRALAARGMVNYDPYSLITLTGKGEDAATEVVRRHELLRAFMEEVLVVEPETAERNACRMEHTMEPSVLERFVDFLEFVDTCPRAGKQWVNSFVQFCQHGGKRRACDDCIQLARKDLRKRQKDAGDTTRRKVLLCKLEPGERGRVATIEGDDAIRKEISEKGIVKGVLVAVERVAAFGDSIEVNVRGYHVTMRKDEASAVLVSKERQR